MVRLQLHITEQQDRALKQAARKRGLTRAELIRLAIDGWLAQGQTADDSLLSLIGAAGPARRTDLSEAHDEVLYPVGAAPVPTAADGDE